MSPWIRNSYRDWAREPLNAFRVLPERFLKEPLRLPLRFLRNPATRYDPSEPQETSPRLSTEKHNSLPGQTLAVRNQVQLGGRHPLIRGAYVLVSLLQNYEHALGDGVSLFQSELAFTTLSGDLPRGPRYRGEISSGTLSCERGTH